MIKWLEDLWSGRAPLWQAYWLGGVLGGRALTWTGRHLLVVNINSPKYDKLWVMVIVAHILWWIFAMVSIWRCSKNSYIQLWITLARWQVKFSVAAMALLILMSIFKNG